MKAEEGFFNKTSYFCAIWNMVTILASRKQNLSVVIQTKILGEQSIFQMEYKIYFSKFKLFKIIIDKEYQLLHEHEWTGSVL